MKKSFFLLLLSVVATALQAQSFYVKTLSDNAVRVRYSNSEQSSLPDWIYVENKNVNLSGTGLPTDFVHYLSGDTAILRFPNADGEFLFGLGQFQDGYNNVAGLPRRLTQVNTQISVPVLISNKGYGIIWNNYAKTEFNLPENCVQLTKTLSGGTETVDVTSTEGGKRETRQKNIFEAEITVVEDGDYALLLDMGQKMARRHNLTIDGVPVIEMQNVWLPPTASKIVFLKKGTHTLSAELTDNDRPVLYFGKVTKETVFQSQPSDKVDYTVIFGTPDQIIKTLRDITGNAPLMPA